MEINNDAHRYLIEETGNFQLAESLELRYCGVCAIPGTLTVVPADAPAVQFHDYPGTMRCQTLPVCQSCREEMEFEPSDDMVQCQDQGCQVVVEDWRAEQATQRDPLFYGYEAYRSAYSSPVPIDEDHRWGTTLRPAGDIHVFATVEQRDAWVDDGPTLIKNRFGYVVEYRARSALSRERGSRLYVPTDEDVNARW